MENKQTAVEWLVEEIEKHYIVNNAMLNPEIVMQLKRQAKAMEKQQRLEDFKKGFSNATDSLIVANNSIQEK